tara:strand:- start:1884 stop:2012 length:129 start_codon:yes stop_codon:yes gene_type:complete
MAQKELRYAFINGSQVIVEVEKGKIFEPKSFSIAKSLIKQSK